MLRHTLAIVTCSPRHSRRWGIPMWSQAVPSTSGVRALEPDAEAFCERARPTSSSGALNSFGVEGWVRVGYCVAPEVIERSLPPHGSVLLKTTACRLRLRLSALPPRAALCRTARRSAAAARRNRACCRWFASKEHLHNIDQIRYPYPYDVLSACIFNHCGERRGGAPQGSSSWGPPTISAACSFPEQHIRNFQYFVNQTVWPRVWDGVVLLRAAEVDIVSLEGGLFGQDIACPASITGRPYKQDKSLFERVTSNLDYLVASVHDTRFTEDVSGTQTACS